MSDLWAEMAPQVGTNSREKVAGLNIHILVDRMSKYWRELFTCGPIKSLPRVSVDNLDLTWQISSTYWTYSIEQSDTGRCIDALIDRSTVELPLVLPTRIRYTSCVSSFICQNHFCCRLEVTKLIYHLLEFPEYHHFPFNFPFPSKMSVISE